jgi:chromosome segregation ATPase
MKSTIPIAGLVGLLSGAAGALAATTLVGREPPAPPVAAAPGATLESLGAELRDLTQGVARLSERLEALEIQTRLVAERREAARSDALEAPAQAASAESQAEKLAAALSASGAELPPEFQKTVKSALEQIRQQEEQDRADRRREAIEERLDERLAELALEIGLTRNQQDDLRNLFLDVDTRRNELFAEMREGGDWSSMRDTMREMRDGIDQSLAKVLSPDQLEKFKESDASRMLLGFGGPGGPGGGPGGGFGGGGDRRDRRPPEGG